MPEEQRMLMMVGVRWSGCEVLQQLEFVQRNNLPFFWKRGIVKCYQSNSVMVFLLFSLSL